MDTSRAKSFLSWLTMVAGFGAAAGFALIFSVLNRPIFGFGIGGAIGAAFLAFLSGNLRLFTLWGLALTVPLEIDLNFRVLSHMGGAGGFSIEISDPFLLGLTCFLVRDLLRGRISRYRFHPSAVYWGGMIMLGLVAVAVGPWRTSASHEVFRMLKVVALFAIVANELRRRTQIRHVALALLVGVVLQSLIALAQYITEARFGLQIVGEPEELATEALKMSTITGESVYRVGGLMSHANVLAAYLAMVLPIAVAFLFTRVSIGQKLFAIGALVLGEVALILTLSRSGWISFALGISLVLVVTYRNQIMRHRYGVLPVMLLLFMAAVAMVFSGPILQRMYESDPGAVQTRLHLAGIAWQMILDRPILGCGLNSYVFEMVPYSGVSGGYASVKAYYFGDLPAVHNIYLLVWAEQGTVGLILFLLVHAAILATGIRNLRIKDDVLFAVNIGCCCGILAVMLDGMASFTLRISGPLRVFWTMAALIVAIRYWHLRQSAAQHEDFFVIRNP